MRLEQDQALTIQCELVDQRGEEQLPPPPCLLFYEHYLIFLIYMLREDMQN